MIARKWLSALSVAAVLSAAACSGGGVGEEGVAEPLPEGSGSVKDRAVEIAFYSSGREPLFVEAVRQKFPEYTIKYIQKGTGYTFPEMIAGGQTFDIYVENARTYARDLVGSKLEQDLTELAKRHQIDLNRFEPGGLEQMMSAGSLYGLPIYGSGLVLYYNKEIFDRFGVPYPKDGMTWEETYELAKRLTRTDNQPYYGYWVKTKSYLRKNQYSLPFADLETDKAVIVNERWKKTIETVYERFSDIEGMEGLLGPQWPGSDIFYKRKDIAMYLTDSDMHQGVGEMANMNWDMVSIPTFDDAPGVGAQVIYTYLGIPNFSKHPEEAMKIIQFLTSDEYQLALSKQGFLTSLNDSDIRNAIGQDTAAKDKNLQAIYYHPFAPSGQITKYDEYVIEQGIDDVALRELVAGKTDINTMLRQAEEWANQAIESNKR